MPTIVTGGCGASFWTLARLACCLACLSSLRLWTSPAFASFSKPCRGVTFGARTADRDASFAVLDAFVAGGGGFVSVHAADNSFTEWPEYNRMIGIGVIYRAYRRGTISAVITAS